MKFQVSILFLLLFTYSTAQNKVFFELPDSCKHFFKEVKKDSIFLMKVIDRCENLSVIQLVTFEKGMYSRNGVYHEFYDTAFKNLRKSGYFLNGIETGHWKEYYINGKLKYEGNCKIIKVTKLNSYPHTIWVIDMQKADTARILFNFKTLDSIKKLAQYHYYPPYESKGYLFPEFYSLRDGDWLYYSEAGALIKREVYKSGVLISN